MPKLTSIVILFISFKVCAIDADLYASLRIQLESVKPDNQANNFKKYIDIRDAYSRFGIKLNQDIGTDWDLLIQYEIPIDLANQKFQLPYNNSDHSRIAKVQLSGPLGMMWYGKGWLAYYNNISYSVDRFSSYYSGWATYTSFREKQTLYYQSPSLGHFNFSYSNIANNGKGNSHRIQYVISAHIDQWNINIGIDDLNRGTDQKIIGAAISYNSTNWYVGGKIERFKSKLFRGSRDNYGVNNSTAGNLFAQYSINKKNSIKLMLANVEGTYGDNIFHFGYDYSYSDKLKVFIEYYSEQTTAAISERRLSSFLGTGDFNQPADSGGDAIVLGFRYDFSLNNKKS